MTTKPIAELTDAEALMLLAKAEFPNRNYTLHTEKGGVLCVNCEEKEPPYLYKQARLDWPTMGPIWERDGEKYRESRIRVKTQNGGEIYQGWVGATDDAYLASLTPRGIANARLEMRYPNGVLES